jgi:succinate dehydrogenase / fumarate reductase, cytochrome b subunit
MGDLLMNAATQKTVGTGALRYLMSSVGRKYLMALTGLVWSGFVFTHMLGNMLIFLSPEAYNKYGHALTSNPLIYLAEAALLGTLLLHAVNGVQLWLRNQSTKPVKYAVTAKGVKGASLASKSMVYSGSITLVFIILHLITFKYGANYTADYGSGPIRDLHKLMVEVFHQPAYIAWYLFCLVLVGVHLFHGFSSSFQTLGLNHPRYNKLIKNLGMVYAVVVAAGFISQPLYVFFVVR